MDVRAWIPEHWGQWVKVTTASGTTDCIPVDLTDTEAKFIDLNPTTGATIGEVYGVEIDTISEITTGRPS